MVVTVVTIFIFIMIIASVLVVVAPSVIASLMLSSTVDMNLWVVEDSVIAAPKAGAFGVFSRSCGDQTAAPGATKSFRAPVLMVIVAFGTESLDTHVFEAIAVRVAESLTLVAADSASNGSAFYSLLGTACSGLLSPVFRATGTVWQVLIKAYDMYRKAGIFF
jgi:hypothetical protein